MKWLKDLAKALPENFTFDDFKALIASHQQSDKEVKKALNRLRNLKQLFFNHLMGCPGGCLCKKTQLPKYNRFIKAIRPLLNDTAALLDVIDEFGLTHVTLGDIDAIND